MRLKHLPARSSFSLFNCTLLIGKCLHFLIAFDSDWHTEDDFSLFLSWCYWWRRFFTMFFMAFLPCVQLQFFEFICGIFRLHIWCFLSHLRQNTLNSDFFFSQHASLCDTHCFYTTLLHLQPLGLILLAKSSEPEFIPVTMHKKCLASTHCFEHWKWESGCLLRKILLPFSFLFNV